MKFDGTSIGDADAVLRAVAVTRSRLDRRPVVVVAAVLEVMHDLLAVADAAIRGEPDAVRRMLGDLRARYLGMVDVLLRYSELAAPTAKRIELLVDEASMFSQASTAGQGHPGQAVDAITSIGERLSETVFAAALVRHGIPALVVDARTMIGTDDTSTRAVPDWTRIESAVPGRLQSLVECGMVPVVGGNIGATAEGVTTTLGSRGSEYTAALVGAALGAEAIELWTDVDRVLTTDVCTISNAIVMDGVGFKEAAESASFSAAVRHPRTLAPAVQRGIPIHIYHSFRSDGHDTRASVDTSAPPAPAITDRTGRIS
jgi:aspartate kinase